MRGERPGGQGWGHLPGIWNSSLQIQVLEDTDKGKKDGAENVSSSCLVFGSGLEHSTNKDSEAIFDFNIIEPGG